MRITVGQKLIGGFMAVALLALFLGLFSIFELNKVNGATKEIGENWLVATSYAGNLRAAAPDMQRSILRHLLETNSSEIAGIEGRLAKFEDKFQQNLALYEPTITSDSERGLFNDITKAYEDYKTSVEEALALSRTGQKAAAYRLMIEKTYPLFNHLNEKVEALLTLNLDGGAAAVKRSQADYQVAMGVTIGVVIAVVLCALALGMFISRQITRNVSAIAKAADGIANGDLDQKVEVTTNDELGDMAKSFRQMIENLSRIIGQVRDAATTVAAGADQISAGTEQLSQSAQAQAAASEETSSSMEEMAASVTQVAGNSQALAANVEETSSSMEEMVASIQQVAGNSDSLGSAVAQTSASIEQMVASIQQVAGNVTQANQVATQAAQAAEGGRQAVSKTIDGMNQINQVMGEVVTVIEGLGKSSEEIGNIIEVIDDIAEQTNLLALNAAIEAARAGEHGRGFAVVADEVRKLAERSAKATGEIAALIKGIQKETAQAITSTKEGDARIQEGSKLAQSAGDSLSAIVGAVDQVTRLMGQISQATQEQANASQQITQAVGNMSTLTQQVNAATREQAKGSNQILQAVESMNRMTQQVTGATVEQKKGAEQVVKAVESINRSAREAANATDLIAKSSMDLQSQAGGLLEAIAFFKDGQSTQPRHLSLKIERTNAPLLKAGKA